MPTHSSETLVRYQEVIVQYPDVLRGGGVVHLARNCYKAALTVFMVSSFTSSFATSSNVQMALYLDYLQIFACITLVGGTVFFGPPASTFSC